MDFFYIGIMKKKPLLITIACLAVAFISLFFFVKAKYFRKADTNEITQFVKDFSYQLNGNNTDSLRMYFAEPENAKVTLFLKVMQGKTGLNGKSAPLFKLSLDADNLKVLSANSDISVVQVPVFFLEDETRSGASVLDFTIRKVADHQYKFIKVKTDIFIKDYVAFESKIRVKKMPATVSYDALTLNAFKNAQTLKTKYDSVAWFDHVNKQTYYYVVKGKFNIDSINTDHFNPDCKMGLVGPQLQEIIPAEYDLIRNVNGTVDGLIEVQKSDKRGFYNLTGKLVVPVTYDQIFPLNGDDNLAVLRSGDDFFYLKSDTTISEKIAGFNLGNALPKIKFLNKSVKLTDSGSTNIMEFNSRERANALMIAPSFLVDLGLIENMHEFTNPLRKIDEDDAEASASLAINFYEIKHTNANWLESAFYSLYDDYVGGRGGLYQTKTVVLADQNKNRLMAFSASAYQGEEEGDGLSSDLCNENTITSLGDSLYEFKTTSSFEQTMLNGSIVNEGPCYHYLKVINGKLKAERTDRMFSCTKFVKLDDSYLKGCYIIDNKAVDHVTPELLRYMKNEIYASYGYRFKNQKWADIFETRFYNYYNSDGKTNVSVNDSLTAIDKYNINWIDQKLKQQQASALAANSR